MQTPIETKPSSATSQSDELVKKELEEKKKQVLAGPIPEVPKASLVSDAPEVTSTKESKKPSLAGTENPATTRPVRETAATDTASSIKVEQTKPSATTDLSKIEPKEFVVEKNAFFKSRACVQAVDNSLEYIKDLTKKGVSPDSLSVTVHGPWKDGNYAIEKLIKSGVEVNFGSDYKPGKDIQKLQKAAHDVREARQNLASQGITPSESFETMLKKRMAEPEKPAHGSTQQNTESLKVQRLPMGNSVRDRVKEVDSATRTADAPMKETMGIK